MLFFPASRPELHEKAADSGAQAVCMDLEDGVAPADKDVARANVVAAIGRPRPGSADLVVRTNGPSTELGQADLRAVEEALLVAAPAAAGGGFSLMLPKISSPDEVEAVAARLAEGPVHVGLIPLIETVRGLARVEEIAAAAGVRALFFGGLDLSIELGAELGWEPLLYARSRVVHAARLAGVGAIDMPWLDVSDVDGLREEAARARAAGFSGKAAIHPSQVPHVLEAFEPSEREIAYARRVMEAAEQRRAGAFLLDGALVDRPVVEAARRVLAHLEDRA